MNVKAVAVARSCPTTIARCRSEIRNFKLQYNADFRARRPSIMTETIPFRIPEFDRINQRTYRKRGVLRQFEQASGWLEPGEQVAIDHVANAVRDGAILDIGIGGGRTAPLMANISANYRGINNTRVWGE